MLATRTPKLLETYSIDSLSFNNSSCTSLSLVLSSIIVGVCEGIGWTLTYSGDGVLGGAVIFTRDMIDKIGGEGWANGRP